MSREFNPEAWSWDKLFGLRIVIVVCFVLSAISGVVGIIMLIRYLGDWADSFTPAAFCVSSSAILIVMAAVLRVLCVIAENSERTSRDIADATKRVRFINHDVNEIATSLSEIADGIRELSVPSS